MPSSPIERLTDTLIVDGPPSTELTDSERCGLLERLAEVPDPRDPRGVRYPLASLLTVAVCAVLSGAVTFAAIADWLDDLPETDLHQVGLHDAKPVATTIWRLLVRVDSVALTSVLAAWLLARNRAQGPATSRRIIAVDGKTVRGTVANDGRCVHLLAAYDVATGITLAQVPLEAKGGEIAQVKPLVDQVEAVLGNVEGAVFVADALHAQTIHTNNLADRGAALFVTVKANQRRLHDRLRALPWPDVPVGDRTRDRGHGRRETRTLKAVTVATPAGLGFPHAAQAVRITRTRRMNDKTTRETAYLIVTLPAQDAGPADLNLWARLEWHIENRLHWRRDVTLREDEQRATTGNGPAVFASLRSTAIGYHLSNGATNVARAIRSAGRHTSKLIHEVTSTGTTTQ
jgi:predicted transposase YbfD/YdcC